MKLQILDCDYVLVNAKPIVRLFCKDENGESVCVFKEGYRPYFYLDVSNEFSLDDVKYEIEKQGLDFDIVEKYIPIGYQKDPKKLIKIIGRDPSKTPEIREWSKKFGTAYEADVLFRYRFMVDHGLRGMGWIEVEGNPVRTNTVKCKAIDAKSITPIDVLKNAPLRYMAFDIEAVTDGGLPVYEKDPIIMISVAFSPEYKGTKSMVLVSKQTHGKDCVGHVSEEAMLKKFKSILEDYDPDAIIGYNIENFDMPYLLKRFEIHNIMRDIGRSEKIAFTKKFAASERTMLCGRMIIDPYYIIRYLSVYDQPHKFRRFDLGTVSKKMLGKTKLDIGGIKEMVKLWNGKDEDVSKLAEYCKIDSELALELVTSHKLVDMNKFIEMAKLSGLTISDLMSGQAARHENALLHELKKRNTVMPCKPKKKTVDEKYKGATVLEPVVGFHDDGTILVLDFKSMYPSMIINYNICPTTLLHDKTGFKETDYRRSPIDALFVKKNIKEGIFPYVAKYYWDLRFETRDIMKKERDPDVLKLLDAKQYALKGMLVSLYGYTGFAGSKFFVPEVAASVTGWGRANIAKTRQLIEDNFEVKVVYGDTDSVFVKTKITDLDMATKLGEEMAAFVTKNLEGLELQFEKLFKRFLILSKKRYAGWKFEKVDGVWKDKIAMKGIETVRRDWCPLTTKTMESVLNTILKDGDITKAAKHVRSVIHELNKGMTPLEELTVVKGITKSLNAYDAVQPHVEVAKKMQKRDPTKAVVIGERLGYVIIKGNQMLSKRAEDPAYVKEKGLEIDSQYYVDNQLMPPLERIFDACGISSSELMEGSRQKTLAGILSGPKPESPEKIVLTNFDSVVCNKCHWESARPTLSGNCPKCNAHLYFSFNGNVGRSVEIKS